MYKFQNVLALRHVGDLLRIPHPMPICDCPILNRPRLEKDNVK
jgi:hypothetical protein